MSSGNYLQLFHYPSKTAFFYDDFLGDSLKEWWTVGTDLAGTAVVQDQTTSGVVRITGDTRTWLNWNTIRTLLVSKNVSFESRWKAGVALGNCEVRMRLYYDVNNFIDFQHLDGGGVGGNWMIQCRSAGVGNTTDTTLVADTSYHIFQIRCHTHGGNHVHFFIDGVEVPNSPILANIPTTYLEVYYFARRLGGTVKLLDVDYCLVTEQR